MSSAPSVLVTLGTEQYPFDRVVDWSEQWAAAHPEVEVYVQHGASRAPVGVEGSERLPFAELGRRMAEASVIVTHAGGGSVSQIWRLNRIPIAVARKATLGEHVDDHQRAFAAKLVERGFPVVVVDDYRTFARALDLGLAGPPKRLPPYDDLEGSATVDTISAMIDELVADRAGHKPLWRRAFRRRGVTR